MGQQRRFRAMSDKPASPRQAAEGPAPPVEQVGYLGLTHFLRSKGLVGRAASLIAAAPKQPNIADIGQAMRQFGAVTPNVEGATLVDYFLALVERSLLERGVAADPLVIYMLHQALQKVAAVH